MLFIPQEIKDKIAQLETENAALSEEISQLKAADQTPVVIEKKNKGLITILAVALVLAIASALYLWFFFAPQPQKAEADSVEAILIKDGKIEKWNNDEVEGVVYRVQIGAYEGFDLNAYKQNIDGLHQDSIDGMRRISLGAFSRLQDAQRFQGEMVRLGLDNAYVVAYKDAQPIGLVEAKKIENQQQ